MNKLVLIYDGTCRFCCNSVSKIRKRDRRGAFEYLPRETDGILDRFPALADEDFNSGMRLITPDGAMFVGADAAHQIARRLPFWRRIAWAYRLPGVHTIAKCVYAWIAANRHRLAGRCDTGACARIPQAHDASPPESSR